MVLQLVVQSSYTKYNSLYCPYSINGANNFINNSANNGGGAIHTNNAVLIASMEPASLVPRLFFALGGEK